MVVGRYELRLRLPLAMPAPPTTTTTDPLCIRTHPPDPNPCFFSHPIKSSKLVSPRSNLQFSPIWLFILSFHWFLLEMQGEGMEGVVVEANLLPALQPRQSAAACWSGAAHGS